MFVFIAIAIGSFIIIAGSFLFGHDHDTGHDHTEAGHDVDHDADPSISLFSPKVLATLTMGFGAAGAIARQYEASYLVSSLWGLGTGVGLGSSMYFVLHAIYKQQSSSLVEAASAIGQTATVTTSIDAGASGEVGVSIDGQYMNYLARSSGGKSISKGKTVKVVGVVGGQLLVEEQ